MMTTRSECRFLLTRAQLACLTVMFCLWGSLAQADGRIKGTGGVSSVSGAGGGGLIPWAVLTGHATRDESDASVFLTHVNMDDYTLNAAGIAVNLRNRVEFSYARQAFRIKASGTRIGKDTFGMKYRLAGDLLYGTIPHLSIGAEYHSLRDPATAHSVGANATRGTDIYLSAARAWIDGIANLTTLLNLNLRYSEANQFGLLGYGGNVKASKLHPELAAGVFLTRNWIIGAEYRHKSDYLQTLQEDSAMDIFIAWLPAKHLSITAAYADFGAMAGASDQSGFYLSLQGSL